jgi:hypothetical protein
MEILDLAVETARESERYSIEQQIREVFGNEVEIIEFEPYDNEGTTTTKRGN